MKTLNSDLDRGREWSTLGGIVGRLFAEQLTDEKVRRLGVSVNTVVVQPCAAWGQTCDTFSKRFMSHLHSCNESGRKDINF